MLDYGGKMNLQLNPGKCEVISHPDIVITDPYLSSFVSVCVADTTLLSAPLFHGSVFDDTWSDRCAELIRAVRRLSLLNAQDALLLLRVSFSAPRVQHLLRCFPSVEFGLATGRLVCSPVIPVCWWRGQDCGEQENFQEEEKEKNYLAQTEIQLIDNIIQLSQVARKPYWSTMLTTYVRRSVSHSLLPATGVWNPRHNPLISNSLFECCRWSVNHSHGRPTRHDFSLAAHFCSTTAI